MAKQHTESQFNKDEFTRIFDEYRTKIDEITRSTERNLHSLQVLLPLEPETGEPEEQPVSPQPDDFAATEPEITETIETVCEEPETVTYQVDDGQMPVTESARTLKEVKKQARQIIARAEEQARKEAKKKTRSQVDKLLAEARKEAEEIVNRAREVVEKERHAGVAASKRQVEEMLRDITEQCRQETQTQSYRVIEEARTKAENLMTEVIVSSSEISRLVSVVVDRARSTINEFETRLQTETEDIARAITDTRNKIEQITMAAVEEETAWTLPETPAEPRETTGVPTLTVRVLGERSNGRNGTQPLFFGQVEMKAESASFDYRYFKNLKKYFVKIPGIKHLQESASEKELSALFDITEPLPLLDLLDKIPQVDEVLSQSDRDISVVFKQPA